MKKRLLLIVTMVMVMGLLAACGAPATPSESAVPSESAAPSESGTPAEGALDIGLVYSGGGRGDGGINDMMYDTMERVSEENGWTYADLENETASNVEPANREFCDQGKDVIINFGFGCIDVVNKLAEEYPEIKFITIDAVTNELPNVVNYTFKEYEGAYLVGAVAGLMTETNKIGFMGGMENDMIKGFNAGYIQGAKEVNPDVEIMSAYVGASVDAFADPTTGKEISLSFYDGGADIIFAAAGSSGQGMFEAAIERDLWCIGVDSNQQSQAPDNMLTSMLKRVDSAVEAGLKSIAEGTFTPGLNVLGAAEDGVGYVNDDTNAGKMPAEVTDKVDEMYETLKAGGVTVASTLE